MLGRPYARLPVSTVIIGCDNVAQVEENIALARSFTTLSETQLADLTARTISRALELLGIDAPEQM